MAKPIIGDCFIGNFPMTQGFGVNPQNYAQFGLKGHDGEDYGISSLTQVISSTDGVVIKQQFDPNGYGNFIEVWDDKQSCMTLYGHLDHATVKVGDRISRGQLIGLSDNTGNSTGPHLHFGFGLTDGNGVRLNQNNGFFGWLNPEIEAQWQITNPTQPVPSAQPASDDPMVCDKKSVRDMLVTKASGYDSFVNAGYKTVEDITIKLKTEQESIDSLNKKIQTDEGTITTQTEQLQQLEQQLKAKQDTIDTLQPQADSANKFQVLFSQCDTDRNTWVTKETSYTRSIAQYQGQIKRIKETSWESASSGTVLLAALHRILPFIPPPTIDNGVVSGGDS